jgi:hypothetical protein
MCRLFAITSEDPVSPMVALEALDVMREAMTDPVWAFSCAIWAGPFEEIKDAPILSGIFSDSGFEAPGSPS